MRLGWALAGGLAWWWPGTLGAVLLGWVCALLTVALLRRGESARGLLAFALLGHALAFYWLGPAIAAYARLGWLTAGLWWLAFLALGAVQFGVLGWLYRRLPLDALSLRAPLAVLILEALGPRIFPWCFGHTQLAWRPLAQTVDLGGVMLVSFLMLWTAEGLLRRRLLPLAGLLGALLYGLVPRAWPTPQTGVVLVQGNTGSREDRVLYERLSQGVAPDELVIWPESALHGPLFEGFRRREDDPQLPGLAAPCLLGTYTWDDEHRIYNAAVAILPEGRLLAPYHKRVLLPFAEYAWLARTQLSAGTDPGVLDFPQARVGPLICYEDVLPEPTRRSVRAGAQVLVNLANDFWFGPLGARQHHVLASFRAIENRRYLVRVTNSGLTAVVDPQGVTVRELPQEQPGVLRARVAPLDGTTLFQRWGELPLRLLALAALVAALLRRPGNIKEA